MKRLIWLPILLLLIPAFGGCADDVEPIERSLTLRVFNADGGEGFPGSVVDQIWSVRVRIYQNGRESKTLMFDFSEPAGRLPELTFGENYQIIVEGLDQEDDVLSDGATPIFDYLPTSNFDQIHVFVSAHNSIEYASALFRTPNGVVSAPAEFEGPDVASRLGLASEALGGQRAGHSVTELRDGRIMVVGGARLTNESGNPFAHFIDTVEIYDPFSGYWTLVRDHGAAEVESPEGSSEAAPMRLSVPRAFHTATMLEDGRIVIAGGYYQADGFVDTSGAVDIIDVSKGTIQTLEQGFSDLRTPRAFHTAHLVEGQVVVIGGASRTFDRPNFIATIEAFDPSSGFFDILDDPDNPGTELSLAIGRGLHTGTTLPDGIIITGGRTGDGVTDTIEFLELKDGELRRFFSDGPRHMGTARFGHTAVWMEKDFESLAERQPTYLAIAGGFKEVHPAGDSAMTLLSGAGLTNSVEFFDTWNLELADDIAIQMQTARAHFQMVETTITRDLLAFGGVVQSGEQTAVTDSVERLFRTLNGGFPLTVDENPTDMNQPRAYSGSASIATHNVMIVGGWNGGNSGAVCGGATITAGCTSELANPGDLFHLGFLY